MMNFTPADVSAADTLLALIADPAKAKAALDELVAAKAAADAAATAAIAEREQSRVEFAVAQEATARAAQAQDDAERTAAEQTAKLDARSAALSSMESDLTAARRALDEDRKQLQQRETQAYAVSAAWDTWKAGEEARLADEKAELTAREAAVAEAESKANAQIADYSNRIAKLVATAKGEE